MSLAARVPSFIQNLLFGSGKLDVLQGGYNSDVILISHSRQVVVKFIGEKKGIRLTTDSAAALAGQIVHYRNLLKTMGVPVPDFLEWAVTADSSDGQVYLFLCEPFSGLNPIEGLKSTPNRQLVESIFGAIRPLVCSHEPLEVGIDPKTNNFVLSPIGITYVDFVPPRYRLSDGSYLVEYPNLTSPSQIQTWTWKYFTPEGLATVGLSQLGRVAPSLFSEIKQVVLKWLESNNASHLIGLLQDSLADLTSQKIEDTENLYLLRLMACELASRNKNPDFVEEFFLGTHYEGQPSPEMLDWAKTRLLEMAA